MHDKVNRNPEKAIPHFSTIVREIQEQTGFFDPVSRLANRITVKALYDLSGMYLNGVLADIGCGKKPYAPLVRHFVGKHIGIDQPDSVHGLSSVDLVGTAYATALKTSSCDCALLSAVIEHLEEPLVALKETFRVLRPGGYALLGVPLLWPVHERPRDFFRYTEHGIEYLMAKSGFETVLIQPLAGYFVTLAHILSFGISFFNKGIIRRIGILTAIIRGIQDLCFFLDQKIPKPDYTWAYMVVARRPES